MKVISDIYVYCEDRCQEHYFSKTLNILHLPKILAVNIKTGVSYRLKDGDCVDNLIDLFHTHD